MLNLSFSILIYIPVAGVHQLVSTKLILVIWIIIVLIFNGKLLKKYIVAQRNMFMIYFHVGKRAHYLYALDEILTL